MFCSLDELTTALEEWIKIWNANARPFKWTKTADQIIDRICRYCSRISGPALREAGRATSGDRPGLAGGELGDQRLSHGGMAELVARLGQAFRDDPGAGQQFHRRLA